MHKKRFAMDHHANGLNDDPIETIPDDPLAVTEDAEPAPVENGKRKRGRKPGQVYMKTEGVKKRKKKSGIIKVVAFKKKKKAPTADAPGPVVEGEYEVEAIVGHKKEKGKTLYRVHWKGYPSSDDSWLSSGDITCKDLLKRYKKRVEKETKDVYVVSKIIDHRRSKGTTFYRVRWENYSARDDTWQPKESLSCNELLKEYHDNLNKEILEREEAKLVAKVKAKSSNNEYEVESVIDSKKVKDRTKYLIRWKGYDESDDTWEFEDTLHCPDLIKAFHKKSKTAKKKTKAKKRKLVNDSGSEDDDEDDSDYGGGKRKGAAGGGEYEVSKVLDSRINKQGKWEFYVMWKGYGPESNTWEPESHLNCTKLINQFLGKDKIPRAVQAKLEKVAEVVSSPPKKKERKPPSDRSNSGGLRGRTKGALKTTRNFRLDL